MKINVEKLVIIGFSVFILWVVMSMSYFMGELNGHREAIAILYGEELPKSSAIHKAWHDYDSIMVIDQASADYVVLECGRVMSADILSNPGNIPLEGAVIHRNVVYSGEYLKEQNRTLLEKIKAKGL